ncbi:unnamed protein product [Cylicocyclus nassatus]|uniref:Uncharacterized protein n=1 Tax=Cylicocyclus nassatus TaxID=53992 RepID=A0AA36MC09_CYLNA|nr:unnamed protein product [Cylicocyclus nassatus]
MYSPKVFGVKEREARFQEQMNRRILIDWVRITGLKNPYRKKLDRLLDDFGKDVLKVPEELKDWFAWPAPAGKKGDILAIRVQISYKFWKYFISTGKNNLYEYNHKNGEDINVAREKTLSLTDQDRLGLYMRRIVKQKYLEKGKNVEISYRRGMIKIGKSDPVKPAMAVYVYDIDINDWNGVPIDTLLSEEEKKSIEGCSEKMSHHQLPRLIAAGSTRKIVNGEVFDKAELALQEEAKHCTKLDLP